MWKGLFTNSHSPTTTVLKSTRANYHSLKSFSRQRLWEAKLSNTANRGFSVNQLVGSFQTWYTQA